MILHKGIGGALLAAGALVGIGFVVVLVLGIARDSGNYLAASIVFLTAAVVLMGAGAWLIARQRQIREATGGSTAGFTVAPTKAAPVVHQNVGATKRNLQLLGGHWPSLVGQFASLGVTVLALWLALTLGGAWAPLLAVVAGVAFSTLIFWLALSSTLYIKPGDLAAISAAEQTSQVWVSATSAGLKAYADRAISPETAGHTRMKLGGYVALTSNQLRFWQRANSELTCVFEIPLDEIVGFSVEDVMWAFVVQRGVLLTLTDNNAAEVQVPPLPSNVKRARYGKASDELVSALAQRKGLPSA
jgi:hypothetical protein